MKCSFCTVTKKRRKRDELTRTSIFDIMCTPPPRLRNVQYVKEDCDLFVIDRRTLRARTDRRSVLEAGVLSIEGEKVRLIRRSEHNPPESL